MKFKPYYHKSYDGGLNNTASPSEIERNQASTLENWDITFSGKLKQRPGLSLIGNRISGNEITGLGAFIRTAGRDILSIEDANLYYLNSSTWTKIANNLTNTTDLLFWFENIQVLSKIYFGNEDNHLSYWDRSSTTLNSCITDLGADVPHGNVYRWHKNHMFTLNNVNVSGTKYSNRLYWSDMGDPETWDIVNDFFDIPGEGRALAMGDLGDTLVLFKERAIQYLSGWGDSSWRITGSASNVSNVSEEVGIAGARAATRVGDEIWFIDDKAKIRRLTRTDFDAFRHDIISTNLETTLAGINKSQISQAVAWSHNNKVYFAFPDETDLFNSIVCVFDLLAARRLEAIGLKPEAWTTYTNWTPNLFLSYTATSVPDLYWGSALDGSIIKADPDSTSDLGDSIPCRWDGKNDFFEAKDQHKRYGFGNITAQSGSGTSNVDIWASIDQSAFANLATITATGSGSRLGPTGSFLLGPTGDARVGGSRQASQKYYFTSGGLVPLGKSVIMSLRHDNAAETAEVNTWSNNYRPLEIR